MVGFVPRGMHTGGGRADAAHGDERNGMETKRKRRDGGKRRREQRRRCDGENKLK